MLSFGYGFAYLASSSFASSCATSNASCRLGTACVCRPLLFCCRCGCCSYLFVLGSLYLVQPVWFCCKVSGCLCCPSKCVLSPRFCCSCGPLVGSIDLRLGLSNLSLQFRYLAMICHGLHCRSTRCLAKPICHLSVLTQAPFYSSLSWSLQP